LRLEAFARKVRKEAPRRAQTAPGGEMLGGLKVTLDASGYYIFEIMLSYKAI
jgi:hypothetical protein